jgi:DUF1680 family protein
MGKKDMQRDAVKPILGTCAGVRFSLGGELGRRLEAVTRQWVLPAPHANPGMLEMFRLRDREPSHDMVPWAGEFAGKYLTHAVQIWRLTRDAELGKHIRWFVGELVDLQSDDGYLGPWPKAWRLRKGGPMCGEPWDAWGHYHAMVGLLLWHKDTDDKRALTCARRIADLLCRRFLDNPRERLHDTGAHEMNQAPVHALAWLYRITGERRYLRMAEQIVAEFAVPPAGDYLNAALAGKEFWETSKPRWESLHPIMGLSELYHATGNEDYRRAFEHLWWSMLKGDRHNNGGFSSGEKATGNPYDEGAIETCCTVAWMAMSVEMLRITGLSVVADEIELSMLNSGFGMMSPSGRWVTYNTPMAGERQASAHTIVFQARAGTPELNCCSVNGPRALGLLCEWAVMRRADGLALNYYGPCVIETPEAVLTQTTDYPSDGRVDIAVSPRTAKPFTLALRIPYWSERTRVRLNGKPGHGATAGGFFEINRQWHKGDTVRIDLDFRPHYWVRETAASSQSKPADARSASIYRGPILLTHDPHHEATDSAELPVLDAAKLKFKRVKATSWFKPWMLLEANVRDGSKVRLCDFASAGVAGTAYQTWLPLRGAPPPTLFARENPLRSQRAKNTVANQSMHATSHTRRA